MEFNLAWYLHGYHVSDDMPFRELHWMCERLNKQLEDEKSKGNGMSNMMNKMV